MSFHISHHTRSLRPEASCHPLASIKHPDLHLSKQYHCFHHRHHDMVVHSQWRLLRALRVVARRNISTKHLHGVCPFLPRHFCRMDFRVRAMLIPFGAAYLYLGWVETAMVHEPGLFPVEGVGLRGCWKDMLTEHVGVPRTTPGLKSSRMQNVKLLTCPMCLVNIDQSCQPFHNLWEAIDLTTGPLSNVQLRSRSHLSKKKTPRGFLKDK
jgi:hypothetical protein